MLAKREFQKLGLSQKYQLIKEQGDYVASRFFETYRVHLYNYSNYFVEVWTRIGMKQICWIEVVYNTETLNSYTEDLDILKGLGFDK